MKIAVVTKMRMPEERGIAFAVAMMCRSFSEINYDVEQIIPNRKQVASLEKTNYWTYYETKSNLYKITKLWALELNINHLYYLLLSWSFSLSLLLYLIRSKKQVIYLFHDCKEALFLLRLISPFYRPLVVYEVHHPSTEFYNRILDKLALNRADLLAANTFMTAKYYTDQGYPKGRAMGCHVGVDTNTVDYRSSKKTLRKKLKLPQKKLIIGYGGRFTALNMEKGIPELIRATTLLRKTHKNIFLICVGGPAEYVKKYQKEAFQAGLGKKDAVFLDSVPVRTLYEYMRAFDICVMPFPWTEHFAYRMSPLKMFEYMASKNPLVATDLPVVREVLKNKVNCLLVKPSNSTDLARGIEEIIKNPKLAAKISRTAFAQVASRYTWKARAQKISEKVSNLYSDQSLPK